MRWISISLLSLALPISATYAAETVSEAALAKALHRYQNVTSLEVDFEQLKTLKEMKRPLHAKGHLSVHPPEAVDYRIVSPSPLHVSLTPEKITIESGSGAEKETQTMNVADLSGSKEQRQMQSMVAWLKLDPKQLASQYDVVPGEGSRDFKFTPRAGQEAPFTSLELKLSRNDEVKTLVMNETSGDKIEFLFETPKLTYKPAAKSKSK